MYAALLQKIVDKNDINKALINYYTNNEIVFDEIL
jgi:hypothetical protein